MKRKPFPAVLCLVILMSAVAVLAARQTGISPEQKAALDKLRSPLLKAVEEKPLDILELAAILKARREAEAESAEDATELKAETARRALLSLRETLVERIRTRYPDFDKPKEEEEEPLILKYYDVADIVFRPPNYEPAPAGLGGHAVTRGAGGMHLDLAAGGEEAMAPGIGSEELVELIEARIAAESEEGSIRYSSGQLVARKVAAVHQKIEKLLSMLREQLGYTITLQVKFVRLERNYYRQFLDKRGIIVPGHFTQEMISELLAEAGKDKPVQIVSNHEITAYEAQSVILREGRQVSLVSDYEVSGSGVIPVMNSVIQNIEVGLIAGLTPVITGDRKQVDLTVKGSYVSLIEPVTEIQTKAGPIQQPQINITKIRTTIRIPDRQVAVIGGVFTGSDASGDPMLLIVKPIIGRLSAQK